MDDVLTISVTTYITFYVTRIVCGIRPELVARMRWNKEELISCLVQLIYSNLSFLLAGEEIIQTVECYNLTMLSKRFTKVKPNMKMTSLIDKLNEPR